MRWIQFNIILLAGLLVVSGSSSTRSKRDINKFKNFLQSLLPGTSKVPNFGNTFSIPGHNNFKLKIVPKSPSKIEINNTDKLNNFPSAPLHPLIAQVYEYLGTKSPEETLNALDGMKNLLQSGILDAKKEVVGNIQIDTMNSASESFSSLPLKELQKGDEIVFIESMLTPPTEKIVYKPASLLFEHGFFAKPTITTVKVSPTKFSPTSQYYYHEMNDKGTTTYVETKPIPEPPKLDDIKYPTPAIDYTMLPQRPANRNPFGYQASSIITEESSSSMTKHPAMFLPAPSIVPLLQTESNVYVTDTTSGTKGNRNPFRIPEPPSLTEVDVPPVFSYEETLEMSNSKPVKILNVDEYPNRFSYTYVTKDGQTITYSGSKYDYSISEPMYEHVIPSSLYPIADYHLVKEFSSNDFMKSVPIRQPYAFSYGIGLPTKMSYPTPSFYAAQADKGTKLEDIDIVPGSSPTIVRQPYAFSYGVGIPPAMPLQSVPVFDTGKEKDDEVEVSDPGPIRHPYAFSYSVSMPQAMPLPSVPVFDAGKEKDDEVEVSGSGPIRQPYAFSYGVSMPQAMPLPSGPVFDAGKHKSEREDFVEVSGPGPIRMPYAFSYGVGMSPAMPSSSMQAVDAGKHKSEKEDGVEVSASGPIRQQYAFSYGVSMPQAMPLPSGPVFDAGKHKSDREDFVEVSGPGPIRMPYAFSYGVGMSPAMPSPSMQAVDAGKHKSEKEDAVEVSAPGPMRQPYAFSYGVNMPQAMPLPSGPVFDAGKHKSERDDFVKVSGPGPIRMPYAFSYGVGMPPAMPSPSMQAVDAGIHKSEKEDAVEVSAPGPIRMPYAFSYGVDMPPAMPLPSESVYAGEAETQKNENKDTVEVYGPGPVRQPYSFSYGVGMSPSSAPVFVGEAQQQESGNKNTNVMTGQATGDESFDFSYGANVPPNVPGTGEFTKESEKEVFIEMSGSAPMIQPYSFDNSVGISSSSSAPTFTAGLNEMESENGDIVVVSDSAPPKQSYAFSYGVGMPLPVFPPSSSIYAPGSAMLASYAAHLTPHPGLFALPDPSGMYQYGQTNEQMYNSGFSQIMCDKCAELPPHILTRVQRLTSNAPTGQVFGVNPYAVYQPDQLRVPNVNNFQENEPVFPEKNVNEDDTNGEASSFVTGSQESPQDENIESNYEVQANTEDIQEESMTVADQHSSLNDMPIVVEDPLYEYNQINSDGSSTSILGHRDDSVSVDVESNSTEESVTLPYLAETVY